MNQKNGLPNISGNYINESKLEKNHGKSRKVRQEGDLTNVPGYGQVYYNQIAEAYFLKYWNAVGVLAQAKIQDGNTKIVFKETKHWKRV